MERAGRSRAAPGRWRRTAIGRRSPGAVFGILPQSFMADGEGRRPAPGRGASVPPAGRGAEGAERRASEMVGEDRS